MDHEARIDLVSLLVGTAYGYLCGHKKMPFVDIASDLTALLTCGLINQPWFVSAHALHHENGDMPYYDVGIMTDGEPILVRAVMQNNELKTTLH